MQSMTIEQLRAASEAGGIAGVTLKGKGGKFLVQIATRSGSDAVLAKARSTEPRRFGNPAAAMRVLCAIGLTIGQFDASEWKPDERDAPVGHRGAALREAHQSAAYNKQLAAEVQASIDDPRPGVSHDDVMSRMEARIANGRKRP